MRASNSNVVHLPLTKDAELATAILAFDAGDDSAALAERFLNLRRRGVVEAAYFLGCMHEDGSNGVPLSFDRAFDYYDETAAQLSYVEGYLAAARMLYHGKGVPQDFKKAFQYYELVADQKGNLVAQFMVGRMYQRGEGVEQNINQARAYYRRAIEQGSVYAALNLSMLEWQEGRWLASIGHRLKAAIGAFRISRRDPRDYRLRGG